MKQNIAIFLTSMLFGAVLTQAWNHYERSNANTLDNCVTALRAEFKTELEGHSESEIEDNLTMLCFMGKLDPKQAVEAAQYIRMSH